LSPFLAKTTFFLSFFQDALGLLYPGKVWPLYSTEADFFISLDIHIFLTKEVFLPNFLSATALALEYPSLPFIVFSGPL
tara:strand:+ start:337 stop:573 length:237 start_codon:yes stop_codon:yes gene_type:complete